MAEEPLHLDGVPARPEQGGRAGVPEGVEADPFAEPGRAGGRLQDPAHRVRRLDPPTTLPQRRVRPLVITAGGPWAARPLWGLTGIFYWVDQFDKDVRLHSAPDLQVQLYLQSLLLGARSIWPPHVEVGVARALNDEARALEVRAQVIEQGGVAGS